MSRLPDHFDLIVVISLPEREDRRQALRGNLAGTDLAQEHEILWFTACRSDHNGGPPAGWTAGPGAWGCLQSHLAVLDLAASRNCQSVLILEDDAVFSPRAPDMLKAFMAAVPSHWVQLYLGGHHSIQPKPTVHPLVWQARAVTATHAYAVAGHSLTIVRNRLADLTDYTTFAGWHYDSHFALSHFRELWPVYTPSWWLAAQEASRSDINGIQWPRRWLHSPVWCMELPFILVESAETLTQTEKSFLLIHDAPIPRQPPELLEWMHTASRRALAYGRLPALPSNGTPAPEILQRLWPAGIIRYPGADLSALADYPFNGLFSHPMSQASGFSP